MPRVKFVPLGMEREVPKGASILSAANRAQAPIGQSCSGDGICGWCRVAVLDGLDHLLPPGALEQRLMEEKGFQTNERAACLAKVNGDITITTTYWGNE
jgi:2Fe-2S ferredoxin